MPELPEVECVRRSLVPVLHGRYIVRARTRRADFAWRCDSPARPRDLLQDDVVVELRRRGKQIAVIGASGRALSLHLGMSGMLLFHAADAARARGRTRDQVHQLDQLDHVHVVWTIAPARGKPPIGQLLFRDPRRFGGVWCFDSLDALMESRWNDLGPDALEISAAALHRGLASSSRTLKSALLDQSLAAGVGNIYADESLFAAKLSPERRAGDVSRAECARLVRAVRQVLTRAIRAGGSTLGDGMYADADGNEGQAQRNHRVYGRGGLPCTACRETLIRTILSQRTTVYCPNCQR